MENKTQDKHQADEMSKAQDQEEKIQWHPAFASTMKIELAEYREMLSFMTEYELSKKPLRLDVLIIKKQKDLEIKKNIGRIFREYNIIEYKSPSDYLSVDDFYKVYVYAYLYKISGSKENEISIKDITVTFVCSQYPKSLCDYLKNESYEIDRIEQGIYYIEGERVPMQIVVTSELKKDNNLWLSSLTDNLSDDATVEKILETCRGHMREDAYQSYMDVVMRANLDVFMEVIKMNKLDESLLEILYEKGLDKKFEQRGREEGKILGVVETLLKLKYDKADILKTIMADYGITEDDGQKIIAEVQKQLSKAS